MKSRGFFLAALVAVTWQGCGPGGTGSGNPVIRVVSQPYAPTSAALGIPGLDWLVPSATAAAGVSNFQFCVTKMKLEADDGSPIEEDGSAEIEAKLGRINLGDGSSQVTWGELAFPSGAAIKKIKIEVHRDPLLCGVDYSAVVNGMAITKDLEFIFVFNSPEQLSVGDTVKVALTNVVSALDQALQAGQLDDQHISDYLDGTVEDSCQSESGD